jgi:hypothetical protein
MKMRSALTFLGLATMAGCGGGLQEDAESAYREWKQTCFATPTNECEDKLVDLNILTIQALQDMWGKDKAQYSQNFGDKAEDIFMDALQRVAEKEIAQQESMRPGFFARTVLAEGEVLERTGNLPIGPEKADLIKNAVIQLTVKGFIAAGLRQPDPAEQQRVQAEYEAMWKGTKMDGVILSSDDSNAPASMEAVPAASVHTLPPADGESVDTSPLLRERLVEALDAVVLNEAQVSGVEEYVEGRQIRETDLNGDGVPDAVVLYTLEGQTGTHQTLAVFYRTDTRFEYRGGAVVNGGATNITPMADQVIAVNSVVLGPDDPDCCPSVDAVQSFKWNGSDLVEIR